MKIKKICKYLFTMCLLIAIIFLIYQAYSRYFSISYTPSGYTESPDSLQNPYQGFYHIYSYTLAEDGLPSMEEIGKEISKDKDTRLALLLINLKNYHMGEISDTGLYFLEDIFAAWSESGKQLIVRFLYDWDGNGLESEPEDIQVILQHMTQVASVVNQYTGHIYILQGVFVGSYGEMHGSKYLEEAELRTLMEHWAKATDPSIYLSVRTPAYWRTIVKPTEPMDVLDDMEENAFANGLPPRLGLFNDGMLGSDTDLGTYDNEMLARAGNYAAKGTREEEIQFQERLCQFVPNGGEVVIDNSFNDFPRALEDLSDMHVSYLNCRYDMAVLEKWKNTTYRGEDVFDGQNGYDYVKNHLGYRYVLRASEIIFHTFQDEQALLCFAVENVGFTNSYRPFQAAIVQQERENGEIIRIPINTDTRFWKSGETVSISVSLPVRNWGTGEYKLYLNLTDPATGEQIKFANAAAFTANGYELGSLGISKRPQK